jgi:hypothetical protein
MAEMMRFEDPERSVRKPASRTRILSARFTEEEFALLENCAGSNGTTLSDWTHDALLQLVREGGGGRGGSRMDMLLFTEVIGLELLAMNALAPLVSGESMTAEQYQRLVKAVQTGKAKAARDVLAKRRAEREI